MRLSNPLVRLPRTTPLSALELILLALVAVQGARLVWALLTPVGPVGDWKAPASFAAPTALGALGSFDPFFRLETGGSGVVTSLNLKLYGVREDRATGRGSAIIALPDGRQDDLAVLEGRLGVVAAHRLLLGEQLGAASVGRFREFTTRLQFDEGNLASGSLEVTVKIASLDTSDGERDAALEELPRLAIADGAQRGQVGVQAVELGVTTGDTPAVRLYRRLGFEEVGAPVPMVDRSGRRSGLAEQAMRLRLRSRRAKTAAVDGGSHERGRRAEDHRRAEICALLPDSLADRTVRTVHRHSVPGARQRGQQRGLNENYARELLELFTIGKGPQIGDGDYSYYTEADVAAGAKILTGYTVDGLRSNTMPTPVSIYVPLFHDNSTKQLSYHFGNQTVPNNGDQEYADYIDIIFGEDQVATFICTKIYRFFVNYDLTPDVLANVIPDMATTLISNNYEILPVMDQLLKSEHFYDVALRGAILKSPMDMLFSMFNITGTQLNHALEINSEMYIYLYYYSEVLGQAYGGPPAVAGWPAYYQAPSYTKLWVNSTHLKTRFGIAYIFTVFTGLPVGTESLKLDVLPFLDGLTDPSDPTIVIEDICDLFFPKAVSATKKATLKYLLLGGQPDFEWGIQYDEYQADPLNPVVSQPVRSKVELVLFQVFQMPEFQTI